MAKIIITGGAGFIGSNLCKRLAENKDNRVLSIDNYFTGSVANHHPGVTYCHGEAKDITKLAYDHGFADSDYVFHFGEYSRVEQSYDDIQFTFLMNQQLIKVLEFCRFKNAKLIYSGSSTKFADEGKALSPYAWTKATNTDLVKTYAKWFGIDYVIVYFYNVYGPGEISTGEYSTLIAKFNQLMVEGKPLSVVSPGTQKRNFTHIDDVVEALEIVSERGQGDGYGIGCETAYDVLSVAKAFGGPIEMVPGRRGNRMSAPVHSDKTKALGWEAKYNLLDYINKLNENRTV